MNRLFNKTKNIAVRTFGLCLMLIAAVSFSSCSSDNDPFFTATEDDAPRFLNSDLPKVNEKGELGSFGTILRTNNFKFGVIATPVDYTTITWYIDDELVYTGDTIDQKVLAGDHIVKVVATTTKGLSCYRVGKLTVTALASDPQVGTNQDQLFVFPGQESKVNGCLNINKVAKMYIGGKEVSNLSTEGDEITFTTPTDLSTGIYRVVLEDAEGNKYGGNTVTVVNSDPVIRLNCIRMSIGAPVTITGYNLDKVQIIKVGDTEATITAQTANTLTFTCNAELGEHALTAVDKNAKPVKFFNDYDYVKLLEESKATVVKETTVWEGNVSIDWNLFEEANNQIKKIAAVGTKVVVYGTINASDYHQIRFMGNWDAEGEHKLIFPEYINDYHWDGNLNDPFRIEIELTEADVKIIKETGFRMSGHGVVITSIAYM